MKKLILSTVVILVFFTAGLGQNLMPYQLNGGKEALITGSSVPFIVSSVYFNKKLKPLTSDELSQLDAASINGLDRFTTQNFNSSVIKRSDITLQSSIGLGFASNFVIPAVYNSSDSYGKQVLTLGIMWLETNLVNYALTEFAKTTVKRSRPFLYGDLAPDEMRFTVDARKSFFSGHTSFSAANSFYAASIITAYQSGSKWNPLVWGVASLPPLLAAVQRVRAGKHFPTDVFVGYVVGAACGILIPKLHSYDPTAQGVIKNASVSPNGLTVQLLNVKWVL